MGRPRYYHGIFVFRPDELALPPFVAGHGRRVAYVSLGAARILARHLPENKVAPSDATVSSLVVLNVEGADVLLTNHEMGMYKRHRGGRLIRVLFFSPGESVLFGQIALASALEDQGIQTAFFLEKDAADLNQTLDSFQPDWAAFTLFSDRELLGKACRALERARSFCPNINVAVGGPLVTTDPSNVFELFDADIAIRGAGEAVFPRLLASFADDGAAEFRSLAETMKGVLLRRHGTIIDQSEGINRMGRRIDDFTLNVSLYAKTDNRFRVGMDFLTSRGCNNRCSFCTPNLTEGKWIPLGMDRVFSSLEDIRCCIQAGILPAEMRMLTFSDNNFIGVPERVAELKQAIRANEELWRYFTVPYFQASINNFLSPPGRERTIDVEAVRSIKGMSASIAFGTDSFSDHNLARLNKGYMVRDVEKVVASFEREDIRSCHSCILTDLETSPQDLVECIFNMFRLSRKYANLGIGSVNSHLIPIYGTRVHRQLVNDDALAYCVNLNIRATGKDGRGREYSFPGYVIPRSPTVRFFASRFNACVVRDVTVGTKPDALRHIRGVMDMFLEKSGCELQEMLLTTNALMPGEDVGIVAAGLKALAELFFERMEKLKSTG